MCGYSLNVISQAPLIAAYSQTTLSTKSALLGTKICVATLSATRDPSAKVQHRLPTKPWPRTRTVIPLQSLKLEENKTASNQWKYLSW